MIIAIIFIASFSSAWAQLDSSVVGVSFTSYNAPINYNLPVFIKWDFDANNKLKSYTTGQNPDNYIPGTSSTYSYDAQSRLIGKDSVFINSSGGNTLRYHESFGYANSGALSHHMFLYDNWFDSTIYVNDLLLRDSINVRYINSLQFPQSKSEYFYHGLSLSAFQIVESSYDSVLNIWSPHYLHNYTYTSFDSLAIDSVFQFNSITQSWDQWKLVVNNYSVNHNLIDSQVFIFLNGNYFINSCRSCFYNSSNQITRVDEYSGACGGSQLYRYQWTYDSFGNLKSYTKEQNLSSLNCGWVTISNYQFDRDVFGRVLTSSMQDLQPGVPCTASSTKKEFYYKYANRGEWKIDVVAPNSSSAHCEGDSLIAFLLSMNAPVDALSYWKINGIVNSGGPVKSISIIENLVVSAFSSSFSLGDSVFSADVNFNVLGKSILPILCDGSPNNIEKCDNALVYLKTDSVKLKNPTWYFNGHVQSAFNGKFTIPVSLQGVYSCQSNYVASPFCSHSSKIYVDNVSPHPTLSSHGSNIANLLTVIADDSFKVDNSYDWYKDGKYLVSNSDGKLNVSSPGIYYCKVTNQLTCKNTSSNLIVNLYNSIGENDGVWFENPTSSYQVALAFDLSIWPIDGNSEFRIFDVDGRLIAQKRILFQDEIFQLPHVNSNYLIAFYTNDQLKLVKKLLVVNK